MGEDRIGPASWEGPAHAPTATASAPTAAASLDAKRAVMISLFSEITAKWPESSTRINECESGPYIKKAECCIGSWLRLEYLSGNRFPVHKRT
ncbi:hypothetical protein GCM10010439_20680 [Actinocorallia aurantiaca]|uniref:Uncharacterized protein n=1 Tax=Actinocorallia aurantiaca TaxID=46204 RepID=A0ABN3U4C6_9ACTN